MATSVWAAVAMIVGLLFLYRLSSTVIWAIGVAYGRRLRQHTQYRRSLILSQVASEQSQFEKQEKPQAPSLDDDWEEVEKLRGSGDIQVEDKSRKDWEGIIGFFHPFCNAGGGGERVLWAAIRVTQQRWPKATCVVYTGDHDVHKQQILQRVEDRFNIRLHAPTVVFLYLSYRHYVLASTWPRFTLLGQSVGSVILGFDAFSMLVPDMFIDTMGYAFTLALSKFLFPKVPTAAYVHYPTISTDMLSSLSSPRDAGRGLNAGLGEGWRGQAKRAYWEWFARLYGWVGGRVDVVMTNSSWTQAHIRALWGPHRTRRKDAFPIDVVYPPTAVEELEREIEVSSTSEQNRQPTILYIAQFRPEKNHQLVLTAFAKFLKTSSAAKTSATATATNDNETQPRLLLIGSVRNSADETYIYSLRLLAHELHITTSVTFVLNAPWSTILSHLRTVSVGINAMWNEHFGIGVVEYQAAGLISVVNDSGGPKNDIVVDDGDGPTGFHASDADGYADAMNKALTLAPQEALAMRLRARRSAKRFGEAAFDEKWVAQMERLMSFLSINKAV